MRKLNFVTIFLILISCSGIKSESHINFKIDPNIKSIVEQKIKEFPMGVETSDMYMFETPLIGEFFVNDSLEQKSDGSSHVIFRSFYLQEEDTLKLTGGYGMFGGFGFSSSIVDNSVTLKLLVSSDEVPLLSYTKDGALQKVLHVPLYEGEMVLSSKPVKGSDEIIYGKIILKSKEFYSLEAMVQDRELVPRKKNRMNLTIFFKTSFVDLEK